MSLTDRSMQRFTQLNSIGLRVQQELQPEAIYRVMADTLRSLGLNFVISLWDEPERSLRLEYLSLPPETLAEFEKLTDFEQPAFSMDLCRLPPYQKAMEERQAVLDDDPSDLFRRVLPDLPADQADWISARLGPHKLIVAPLFAGEKVTGFFEVWGADLGS